MSQKDRRNYSGVIHFHATGRIDSDQCCLLKRVEKTDAHVEKKTITNMKTIDHYMDKHAGSIVIKLAVDTTDSRL